jgi:small subunit ribosomal protein S20
VISSQEKRHRQSLKRHARNKSVKSRIKTEMKKVKATVESGNLAAAASQLRLAMSLLHKAARKRILHPNTAARRISKLARLVHKNMAASAS